MAVLLALLSALAYGTSDFIGGVISSRIPPWTAAFCSEITGCAALVLLALVDGGSLSLEGAAWGVLSGVGSGIGLTFLYRGLSSGRMGVVAPASGVLAALVPAAVGVLTGDRPSELVWTGIVLAVPATFLVAREPSGSATTGPSGLAEGILAGCGFGVGFAAIAKAPDADGFWPVALSLLVGAAVVVVGAVAARADWVPRNATAALSTSTGVLAAAALALFLASLDHGMLTVSAVIAALYPAATVLLAITVLREHVHRAQAIGLGLCAIAVTLVAAG
ncbi:EamA family transporter [Nocardioides sp. CER19]|uniref:EamA family transporter n=1 Tax=Nocardioides sp. CER19 TaxID=3038538 RepID=UPI00244D0796|nr:EamA family transporter [Nocardioides sp. CER19]MDH2416600.1 EamA family transporter [Nocardioides sp. CER19]